MAQGHKDVERDKKITFIFSGTYTRRAHANSVAYTGITQDFWEAGTYPNLGIAEDSLLLRLGGRSGESLRITTAPDDEDSLVMNVMNHADDAHEYEAKGIRDDVFTLIQTNVGFNNATGLAFTATEVAGITWTTYDAVFENQTDYYVVGTYDSALNTEPFANDHPVMLNRFGNQYINVLDTAEGVAGNFNTTFEPSTAFFDGKTLTMTFSSATTAATNDYFAVERRIGTNENSTDIPQWVGEVTSRTTENSVTEVQCKILSGVDYLNTKAAESTGQSNANSVIGIFTTGRMFIVHYSLSSIYLDDLITSDGDGYFIGGVWNESDIYGDMNAGTAVTTKTQTGVRLLVDQTAWASIGNTVNQQITVRANGVAADKFTNGTPSTDFELHRFQFWNNVFGVGGEGADRSGFRPGADKQMTANVATGGNGTDFWDAIADAINTTDNLARFANDTGGDNGDGLTGKTWGLEVAETGVDGTNAYADFYWLDVNDVKDMTMTLDSSALGITIDATAPTRQVTSTVKAPVFLSLADDPNRRGDETGIIFENVNWVETDPIVFIRFGSYSEGTLAKGFRLGFGKGYSPIFDGIGATINGDDIEIDFTVNERGNIWDAKNTTSGLQEPLATEDLPFTMNLTNSKITQSYITLNGGSNLVSNTRTFVLGSAAAFSRKNHVFNFVDVIIAVYSIKSNTFIYSTLGIKKNVTVILDTQTGTLFDEPSTLTPTLTGVRTIINGNAAAYKDNGNGNGATSTQAFNRDFNSLLIRINDELQGTAVVAGNKLTGNNPRNANYTRVNLVVGDSIYTGPTGTVGEIIYTWLGRGSGFAGSWQTGVLHNPSYQSEGEDGPLTDTFEEIYYNDESEETLEPVKEGCERNAIGTIGEQLHPFVTGVTLSDTLGLADARISSTGVNNYSAGSGFIDDTANYSGLVLICARQVVNSISPSTDPTADENNVTLYADRYFNRVKRAGHIPASIHKRFDDALDTLSPVVLLRKDKYWQAATTAEIDTFAAAIEAVVHSVSTGADLGCSYVNSGTWNDNYRKITYNQSTEQIIGGKVGDEQRPYDSVNNVNGRFRDLIDTNDGVTSEGLMEVPLGPHVVSLQQNQTVSTAENSIAGVDTGSKTQTYTHSGGSTVTFTGKCRTTGDILFATLNPDSSIHINDCALYADDLRFTAVSNATHLPIDNLTAIVNSLTFGGSYASFPVNAAADYNITNSDLTINGNQDFTHKVDDTIIRGAHTRTISDDVTDLTVLDAAIVNVNSTSTNGRYGINSDKISTLTYATAVVPVDDIAYASGKIILAKDMTTGTYHSDTEVEGTNFAGSGSAPTLELFGEYVGDTSIFDVGTTGSVSNLNGARLNLASGSTTTIPQQTSGTIVGADKTANLIFTGRIDDGDFRNSTVTLSTNTSSTRFGGEWNNNDIKLPTGGISEFANDAFGVGNNIILGPISTSEEPAFATTDIWEDSSTAGRFLLIRFGGTTIAGGSGSTAYTGTLTDGTPYFNSNGTLFENRVDGDVFYIRGVNESGDNYAIIKHTSAVRRVRRGGVTITKSADNGSNFTDNVIFTPNPFSLNLLFPSTGYGAVKIGGVTTFFTNSNASFDEAEIARGETFEVAWINPGFQPYYKMFTVGSTIPENGTQEDTITPVSELFPITSPIRSGTVVNSVTFNGSNQLVVDVANAYQKHLAMSKLLIQAVMTSQETLKAILFHQTNVIFGSDGVANSNYGDETKFKLTSSTAFNSATKETTAYMRSTTIVGSDTEEQIEDKILLFTSLDEPLGIATEPPGGTTTGEINTLLNDQFNGRNLTEGTVTSILEFDDTTGPDQDL